MQQRALILIALHFLGLALVAAHLLGCPYVKPPTPAPPEAGGPEDCAPACANLARLRCPGWEGSPGEDERYGTPDDVSCAQACVDLLTADPTFTLAPRCVAKVDSCDAADSCVARSE